MRDLCLYVVHSTEPHDEWLGRRARLASDLACLHDELVTKGVTTVN
jgi:hypothetical protein